MSAEMVAPAEKSWMEFETSEQTDKLDDALAKAQGEILSAPKAKVNPHFGNRYADIAEIVKACAPALAKHGIARTQWPIHSTDGRLHIVTRLAHSGQWIRAHFSIPVPKQDPQGYGSAITYAKRFALAAAVGVVAEEEDDDGAGAGDGEEQPGKMNGQKLADYLAAIQTADDNERLKDISLKAQKEAEKDKVALARIIAAKSARYKQLNPKPAPSGAVR